MQAGIKFQLGRRCCLVVPPIPKGDGLPNCDNYCESGIESCSTNFLGEKGHRLCWFAPDPTGCLYGGIVGLNPSEFGLKLDNHVKIIQEDADLETKETNRLTAFLINVLTYASQNYSQRDKNPQDRTRSPIRPQKKNYRFSPLFIGQDYKKVNYNSSATAAKKSTSTRSHYRRGFWRFQAVGTNYEKREWRLIAPTIVGVKNKK